MLHTKFILVISRLKGSYLKMLENVLSSLEVRENSLKLAHRYGYLPYMITRYIEMLGGEKEAEELLKSFEKPLKHHLRCNTLKVSDCRDLEERLERLGIQVDKLPWCDICYRVRGEGGVNLGATHEFLAGMYYLYRGAASLIPPIVLSPGPGDLVADLAAAPGGKVTHMAQLMGNEGGILASDINRERMRALRSNVERMGVRNAVLLRIDARRLPSIFQGFFAKVLLDAPCSGEGIIMIDPGRKKRTGIQNLLKFGRMQVELLNSAVEMTAEGGLILYTTCSIAPEEDEFVIAEVLRMREDVEIQEFEPPISMSRGITHYFGIDLPEEVKACRRLYPPIHGTEGFFLCLLKKV
ncbi:MAG: hypothetical protein DRO10_03275 [Thermoprotei archaeon]|nr:MAG: hypothetical protein DRO10_03275 [Thermoprotei archaeon]